MGQQRVVHRVLGAFALAALVVSTGLTSAAAAPAPTPVQRVAAAVDEHGAGVTPRTGSRQALRLGDGDIADYYLVTDPGCARGRGKARPNAAIFSATKVTLDYTLTGAEGLPKTGTVKVKKNRATAIDLPRVAKGHYELVLTKRGSTTPVADTTFDVLACIGVKTSCHAVTFTNPAGNPAASLSYSGHRKDQQFDADLSSGQSLTVRADYARIDYRAVGIPAEEPEEEKPASWDLGHGTVSVKQKCSVPPAQPGSTAVQSSAGVACSEGGTPANVDVSWAVQPSVKKTRYEVIDAAQQVVKGGKLSGGRHRTLSLSAGAYHYRSYANGIETPFEDIAFSVLSCVQVTPVCRALEIHNPNPLALDVFVVTFDEDDEEDEGTSVDTTATPSGTTTIAWDRPAAYVFVLPTDEDLTSRFVSESLTPDLGFGDVEVSVPQDC